MLDKIQRIQKKIGKLDIVYFVGFLDGEGYVGVKKVKPQESKRQKNPVYSPTLSIGNTNRQVIDWIRDKFGGHLTIEKPNVKNNSKEFYHIELTKPVIRLYIDEFIKYSKVKRTQLILLKNILDMKSKSCRYGGRSKVELDKFEAIHSELLKLNKRGL